MVRMIAFVAAGALGLSAVLIIPATSRAAVTGTVTCELKGSAIIKPGLPLTSPSPLTKKFTSTVTFSGTLDNCTGTQMGTKKGAQIDGGSVKATGKTKYAVGMDQPSCGGLANPTVPTVLKTTVKFTSGGKTIATSKVNATVGGSAIDPTTLTVAFPTSGSVSGGNAFKGQTVTVTAFLDKLASELPALCQDGASTEFDFKGVHGMSNLDVTP